jgi:hypothetical protein
MFFPWIVPAPLIYKWIPRIVIEGFPPSVGERLFGAMVVVKKENLLSWKL